MVDLAHVHHGKWLRDTASQARLYFSKLIEVYRLGHTGIGCRETLHQELAQCGSIHAVLSWRQEPLHEPELVHTCVVVWV